MPAAQSIETRGGVAYATHDGVSLLGDFYLPAGAGPFPALVGVYGVYDVVEMWQRYQLQSPRENNIENFMGAAPMDDPRRYFDASPVNYATFANNQIGVFLSVGTEDDLVNRRAQTDAFLLRLKQANFFVRTCIVQGAPHYWLNDPIEEPASYSGFLAPRLMRFLQERL